MHVRNKSVYFQLVENKNKLCICINYKMISIPFTKEEIDISNNEVQQPRQQWKVVLGLVLEIQNN